MDLDAHYINPKLVQLYDLDSPWSADRDYYLSLAGAPPQNILDLGCGTGLLCNAYAREGHNVTGIDPSPNMLDVARQKQHANKIKWVESTAQNFKSDNRFDLIVMTGHAFQVLLEDKDILATFSTVSKHLKQGGQFVFESRNPNMDWSKEWNYEMRIALPESSVYESRRLKYMHKDRMLFQLLYRFPDEELVSTSELRFLSKIAIEQRLLTSGFENIEVVGDWNGKSFDENLSREMIFVVRCS